jgi:F-type H+-transporting ATPase subunit b
MIMMKMKWLRALPGLLLLVALICSPAVAQQHEAARPAEHPTAAPHQPGQAKPAEHHEAEQQGNEAAVEAGSPGAELAHASREAAGEEGEGHAEFKQSPSVRFVANLLHIDVHSAYWVAIGLNFAVLALLVAWGLKKNLPSMFRARTVTIQKGIEEARKASEEANRRLADIETRLARLDSEIGEMRAAADQEAAKEEVGIQAAAEEEKRKIVEAARQEIAAAEKAARRELKAYTADLAVNLAEHRIHVDTTTDQALVRSFVTQLGEDASGKDGKH